MRIRLHHALLLFLFAPAARAEEPTPARGPAEEERAAVRAMVEELREEASRLRGLPWKKEVPADLLSREQLAERLAAEIREEYSLEEEARDRKWLRRTGLLKPDQDLFGMQIEMLREFVAGYYDPKTDRLYCVEGASGEAQKPVILHELIHALEDQHFDLDARTRPLEDDPDRLFAEKCLGEGSAEVARLLYESANPRIAALGRQAMMDPAMAKRQAAVFRRVPAYLFVPTLLNYQLGPALVGRFVGDDYPGGMKRLYESPPTSQEQWLHPERWFAKKKDLPQRIDWCPDLAGAAGEGWKVLYDRPEGELDLALFLDYFLGGRGGLFGGEIARHALDAAKGWDGGRSMFLDSTLPGKEEAVIWIEAYAFDTPQDAVEAAESIAATMEVSAERTFRGTGWTEVPAAAGRPAVRRLDYRTWNGRGRIQVSGTRVLAADGVPETRWDPVWAAVEATTFVQDPTDAAPAAEGD